MKTQFRNIQKYFLLSLFLISGWFNSNAQPLKKFSSHSFTVDDGLLVNRIVDIAEDVNGFIWVSSGAGLQRFDGSNFTTIFPQPGLPETNHPHFFKLKDGTIWLSYYGGISSYNSTTNKFHVVLQNLVNTGQKNEPAQYETSPTMPVVELDKVVWCWSLFSQEFIAIDKSSFRITDSLRLDPDILYLQNFKKGVNGNLFFISSKGILELNLTTKRILNRYQLDNNLTYFDFYPYKKYILLITTKGINKIDYNTGVTKSEPYPAAISVLHKEQATLNYLYDNLFTVAINDQLYIMNADTGEFLYNMVNQKNEPLVSLGYVNFCTMDHFQHLWVVTLVHGLIKVNFNKEVIKYYGDPNAPTNFTRCIYPDKKENLVIAGQLYNRISVYDTSQHIIKEFSLPPNTAAHQVSCILKIKPRKYLLFLPAAYSVYLLDAISWKITPVSKYGEIDYYATIQQLSDTSALLYTSTTIALVTYGKQNIRIREIKSNKYSLCGLLNRNNLFWLGATGKYFILSGKNLEHEKVFSLNENVVTKCLFQDKQGYMWMGTERGLYKLNANSGAILRVYTKSDGLADENIYSVIDDDKNNIWFSTNKGISCLTIDGKVVNIYASDGLQGSEYNGNSSAKAADGELFFGGLNGFNSFYPVILKTISKKPEIVMSAIKVMDQQWHGDTASWNLHEIKLPYTQNVISFSFTAFGWYNPQVYNYQYKMDGVDKEWVNAGNAGYARYVLPPGKYAFEYTAGNRFEKNVPYKKFISIIITPPFWQTAWFRIMFIASIALLLIALVRFYDKLKYKRRLRKIEIQQTLQQERQRISRDLHDNIGAYATVLIAGTEELKRKATEPGIRQSAQSVSENAKNIMGSLQETIWVLNNDAITITDFADRFKVYAKKMLQNFPDIQIKFHEQLDNDKELSPSEALNVFRIMQEALQNSLKHARPDHINISVESNAIIHISVKDDGAGFNIKNVVAGNGLSNMRHRAKDAGYNFEITSNENGTEVLVTKK